ncbi:competence protein ComJ [Pirellulimonas nuda]|uniref:competence protein ComJ n=1 Tax=Pirellulimonas nuda TaxID=2528009 RepID=UPI0011A59C52|nr:competence protein ComJ [Pirellulimonas nuda]
MASFTVSVSYSQIAAFNGELENPFNDWTDQHVAQGFSWRPESVSFKTMFEAGPISVEVQMADDLPTPSGTRAIAVPFTCPEAGKVEIASIADGRETNIPPGSYQLLFETGLRDNTNWCRFTFIPNGSMIPQILIPDQGVKKSDHPLVMDAKPA